MITCANDENVNEGDMKRVRFLLRPQMFFRQVFVAAFIANKAATIIYHYMNIFHISSFKLTYVSNYKPA